RHQVAAAEDSGSNDRTQSDRAGHPLRSRHASQTKLNKNERLIVFRRVDPHPWVVPRLVRGSVNTWIGDFDLWRPRPPSYPQEPSEQSRRALPQMGTPQSP